MVSREGKVWKFRLEFLLKEVGGGPKHNTWSVGSLAGPLSLLLEFIVVRGEGK